ncbi:MAG: DEAD/DEAH box helicase [Chitinophagales bacterium]|nr:DEAD/DEAH box helicase [Chitinophagales bacterium]
MSLNKIDTTSILHKMGFKQLKPMQEKMLNASEKHNNIILLSPTGSGKTLGFILPLLKRIDANLSEIQCIILSPTRELALQIENVLKQAKTGYKILTCYGGHPFSREKNSLKNPPKILIATPGRLLDHLKRETFNTNYIKNLIIDEYDKCLELGFSKEMQAILYRLPNIKFNTLTSATEIDEIPNYLKINKAKTLNYLNETEQLNLKYFYINSDWETKNNTLAKLLFTLNTEPSIIFCNFKKDIEDLSDFLNSKQINHSIFYGDLEQTDREKALLKFRNGTVNILLATDLASRGLDIPEIKNIIHYQIPGKEETFIHRNGRTARMDKSGRVFLILINGKELPNYINSEITPLELSNEIDKNTTAGSTQTIYINAGKMHKISKGDIVGFLCKEGGLQVENIGLIEVKERVSYVAIENNKATDAINNCTGKKIKKVKVLVALA